MATDNPSNLTEAESLYLYLGEKIANGGRDSSAVDLLANFEEYYRQLQDLRAKIAEAEESSARGESAPLDVEDVIRRGRERAALRGITD
ncbi:MAG: hypothetical protein GXP28_01390 [Planctomycetes bacterium]|nr:hypothetical protein [Planctomycetota bacterium]